MSEKNTANIFSAIGGAVKFADHDAEFPTGADFEFDPAVWGDLGLIKTPPSLTPDLTTNEAEFWNSDTVVLGSSERWTAEFGHGQFDWENGKLIFNFDEIGTDGGFTPGSEPWSGQLAFLVVTARGIALLHIPNATYTSKGTWEFVKKDASEVTSSFACNPDSRLDGGKPWKFFPATPWVKATPAAPVTP
jgi:hypothetical protein